MYIPECPRSFVTLEKVGLQAWERGDGASGQGIPSLRPQLFHLQLSHMQVGHTEISACFPTCKENTLLGRNVPALAAPFFSLRPTWRALIWQKNKPFLFMSLQTSCLPSLPASQLARRQAGPDTQADIPSQTLGPRRSQFWRVLFTASPRRLQERVGKNQGLGPPRDLLVAIYQRVCILASFFAASNPAKQAAGVQWGTTEPGMTFQSPLPQGGV